jgi:hypothetical protein
MEKVMKQFDEKFIFDNAKAYLLSFDEITEDILLNQITYQERNDIKSLEHVYHVFLGHAKNRRNMSKTIGDIEIYKNVLMNFNPHEIMRKYDSWEKLFNEIMNNNPHTERMDIENKKNYWVIYCKSMLSIAEYLTRFDNFEDYKNYVEYFTKNDNLTLSFDLKLSLALLMDKEIFGFGFALACDFIKESFSPEFVKPDVHLKDIFIELNFSNKGSSDFKIYRDIIDFSKKVNEKPYSVDKVFWLIGTGNFYKHNIKIKSKKKLFIEKLLKGGDFLNE